MKKYILDLTVRSVTPMAGRYALLRLTADSQLPPMLPGQFVQVRVDGSPGTFLRRPISINKVSEHDNELWLLVAAAGEGTRWMTRLREGDTLNCVLPLGNGFTLPGNPQGRYLLVGGGVGVAPLLFLGERMQAIGIQPTFLLGARTAGDLLLLDHFRRVGRLFVTTEDGSAGERGFVTQHSLVGAECFDRIYTCGPKPMMMAVARYARHTDTDCEVSLENMMACGLGACLCCVENTTDGHVCVCKEGPVFNINQLLWPI